MRDRIRRLLYEKYGIQALSMHEIPPGWSASAWKIHSGKHEHFLKVYDKRKPSIKIWIDRIDSYVPVVLWLYENTELRDHMTAPILTKDGSYKCEDADFLYMLFPFIDGHTIGGEKLTTEQVRELARITAILHTYDAGIPVPTDSLKETFDIPFYASLGNRLISLQASGLKDTLAPYTETVLRSLDTLNKTAASLRGSGMRYVLCHTDIHGWNLMQSKNLILIDWEGLKLTPAESDLFSLTETYFFEYAWEDFMHFYRSVHKAYQVDARAMSFYRLRRRLEDIDAFLESILLDSLSKEETERSLHYLIKECSLLDKTNKT